MDAIFPSPDIGLRAKPALSYFAYVQLISFLSIAVCIGLLFGAFSQSFLWALPASFVIPTAILLYARHWGRFSWLALNFLPAGAKKPKKARPAKESTSDPTEELAPEMDVQEIDVNAEAISAGLPPAFPNTFQAGVPATPNGIVAGLPVSATATVSEEEDEWATDKKPYGLSAEDVKPKPQISVPAYDREPESDADKPVVLSKYYDERARRENEEKVKRDAAAGKMPPPTRKAPSFQEALLRGVWNFMIYSRTLRVWVNLVILTAVELLFVLLVVQLWPRLPD